MSVTRTALLELIEAAHAMRQACVDHATARMHGSNDYGELAKADKAARKRFEELAARALEAVDAS